MRKRLNVRFDEEELKAIRRAARGRGLSTSAWVRQTLHAALRRETSPEIERKLAALERATLHRFPAPPIDFVLREIESGIFENSK